jgi:hypothetical protein
VRSVRTGGPCVHDFLREFGSMRKAVFNRGHAPILHRAHFRER